ncbi:hypothetical protein AD998_03620 [bacterium 336/3]|nr:hypothetical protein AD998_03620 [bacterium 336/3]
MKLQKRFKLFHLKKYLQPTVFFSFVKNKIYAQMYKIFIKKNQKTLSNLYYLIFSLILFACNGSKQFEKIAKKQQIEINPSPLEVHGGEVHFNIKFLLPTEMLQKDAQYEAKIFFTNAQNTKGTESFIAEVGSITFNANNYLSKKKTPLKEQDFAFLYEHNKSNGDIVVKTTQIKGKKKFETPYFFINKGIIQTSMLFKDVWQESVFLEIPKNEAFNFKDYTINFFFEQSDAVLQKEQLNNYEEFFLKIIKNQEPLLIESAFSLEGSEKNNQVLANNRAEALKKHLAELAKNHKLPFPQIKQQISNLKTHFQELVQESNLASTDTETIFNIIQNTKLDSLDAKLSNYPFYQEIRKKVYPKLRYARIQLRDKNSSIKQSTLEEQIHFYEQNIKINNSSVSHHNLGKIQFELAQKELNSEKQNKLFQLALYHTVIANQIDARAETFYQEVLLYTLTKQSQKAEESLNKAIKMQLKHEGLYALKGLDLAKKAKSYRDKKYKESIKYFSEAGNHNNILFNKALAYLLIHEYDKAEGIFNTLIENNYDKQLVNYCVAIIEARKGNEEKCIEALGKIIQIPEWKNKVKNDLEFHNFKKSSRFQSLFN